MDKVKTFVLNALKFVGITLLYDLGVLLLVVMSCQFGTKCTAVMYSERMFWGSLAILMMGAVAIFASLSTTASFGNVFTAGMDAQIATDIIKSERKGLDKRTNFALKTGFTGAIGIGIAALIDILTR